MLAVNTFFTVAWTCLTLAKWSSALNFSWKLEINYRSQDVAQPSISTVRIVSTCVLLAKIWILQQQPCDKTRFTAHKLIIEISDGYLRVFLEDLLKLILQKLVCLVLSSLKDSILNFILRNKHHLLDVFPQSLPILKLRISKFPDPNHNLKFSIGQMFNYRSLNRLAASARWEGDSGSLQVLQFKESKWSFKEQWRKIWPGKWAHKSMASTDLHLQMLIWARFVGFFWNF